jgi:superfamily II DNA or RNA helicase
MTCLLTSNFKENYDRFLQHDYSIYKRKKHNEYREYLKRYPSFSKRTNQQIGRDFYERYVALQTDSIIHDDLPSIFWIYVLGKNCGDIELLSFHKDRLQQQDIGGDFYNLSSDTIGQAKFYNGSQITYHHMSHTAAARDYYGIENCMLARTSAAKKHSMVDKFILSQPRWSERIIDIDESYYQESAFEQKVSDNLKTYEKRPWQIECGKLIHSKTDITIQAAPGAGKGDLCIHYFQDVRKGKHLYLVPRVDLATRMKSKLDKDLGSEYKILVVGDKKKLPKFVVEKNTNVIIICLFQSLEKVKHIDFETVWKDEAHLHPDLCFKDVKAKKYVQMSATMDEDIDLSYKYTLTQAIQDKVVADYRIGIVVMSDGDTMKASCEYICEHPEMYPVQVFCNSQKRVKDAYERIKKHVPPHGLRKPTVDFVLGEMSANKKENIRNNLETGNIDILIVCQCFSVGTDMPRLKSTFMLDKKSSESALKQAVTRSLRRHHTKTEGYIYIPIFHSGTDGESEFSCDEKGEFAFLISCLRDEDERLHEKEYLRCTTHILRSSGISSRIKAEAEQQNDACFLFDTFYDILKSTFDNQCKNYAAFVDENKRRPKENEKFEDWQIGRWQGDQRTNYKKRRKTKKDIPLNEREQQLERLPLWAWKNPDEFD